MESKTEKEKATTTEDDDEQKEQETQLESCIFDPPLYRQRYSAVTELLRTSGIKSAIDFGAAECNIIQYFKGIDSMEQIVCVDIDGPKLEGHQHKARPLTTDYLQPRDKPLIIQLFCGSLIEFDSRLKDVEAISMIEVIEHLNPDVLEHVPKALFGQYSPSIVVMTTPNSEYNVLFPNFSGFRHWDHKFEWTRKEFRDWCEPVAEEYGYTVTYEGIGSGPEGTKHLGHCSQMAVFRKQGCFEYHISSDDITVKSNYVQSEPYELIEEYAQPSLQDSGFTEYDRTLHDVQYYINMLTNDYRRALDDGEIDDFYGDHGANAGTVDDGSSCSESNKGFVEESNQFLIPLDRLLVFQQLQKKGLDVNNLRALLEKENFCLTPDKMSLIITLEDDDYERYSGIHDEVRQQEANLDEEDYMPSVNREEQLSDNNQPQNTYETEESWEDEIEHIAVQKPKLWTLDINGEVMDNGVNTWRLEEFRRKISWEVDRKVGRGTRINNMGYNYNYGNDVSEGVGLEQYADVDCDIDIHDSGDAHAGEIPSSSSTMSNKDDVQPISGGVCNTGLTNSQEILQDGGDCDSFSESNTINNDDNESGIVSYQNTSTAFLSSGYSLATEKQQPYLTVEDEILCKGCGCSIRKLINGENLCGLTKNCQSSFMEKFSFKFANTVSVSETQRYYEFMDSGGQFEDAEEV